MKMLKNVLLAIVAIVVLALVVAFFIPQDYSVEREVTLGKPKAEVFNYVKFLKNQDNFSKWAQMDPNMKKGFEGTDGTVGCKATWDGNDEVGAGEQTITKIAEGERIDFNLHFIRPFEDNSQAYMTTEAIDSMQTKVKWGFTGKMPYPMNLMKLFMNMDKMIGDDLNVGLTNLKGLMEKNK